MLKDPEPIHWNLNACVRQMFGQSSNHKKRESCISCLDTWHGLVQGLGMRISLLEAFNISGT